MALINGMYVHVVDEQVSREVDVTTHPVEQGIDLTDTVRAKAFTISLAGKIVDYEGKKAYEVIAKLKSLQYSGSLIHYEGRNLDGNMQIQSFETTHPRTNHGGADFTMELRQVRIAKSAYTPQPASVAEKTEEKQNPEPVELTVGSTVVFTGGSVYVSSDASQPAATRSRSTCTIAYVNDAAWATHPYCLQSTDGKLVCGWVDAASIEGAERSSTNGVTNAGMQQVTEA